MIPLVPCVRTTYNSRVLDSSSISCFPTTWRLWTNVPLGGLRGHDLKQPVDSIVGQNGDVAWPCMGDGSRAVSRWASVVIHRNDWHQSEHKCFIRLRDFIVHNTDTDVLKVKHSILEKNSRITNFKLLLYVLNEIVKWIPTKSRIKKNEKYRKFTFLVSSSWKTRLPFDGSNCSVVSPPPSPPIGPVTFHATSTEPKKLFLRRTSSRTKDSSDSRTTRGQSSVFNPKTPLAKSLLSTIKRRK